MTMLTPSRCATVLAGIAGYVDTLGFVALFGLFTAHVTGNFVLIGSELAHPQHGIVIKLFAFPAFVAGVVLARLLSLAVTGRPISPLRALMSLQSLFLLAFMVAGLWATPLSNPDALPAIATGMLGALAMGVQNGTSKLVLTKVTPTTVMTGNVTGLVIELVDYWTGHAAPGTAARVGKIAWPVAAFGTGAIVGALAYVQLSFWALLPAVTLAALVAACGKAE